MTMIPQLGAAVKAVPLPLYVKDKILDKILDAVLTACSPPLNDSLAADFLPSDPRIREVLENGGFTQERVDRHGRVIYSYERVSRDGLPLIGAEAKRPPRYELPTLGILVCFCDCLAYRTSHQTCKHGEALTGWLTSPVGANSGQAGGAR